MKKFDSSDIDRIIQMCWEDRTPFDAIKIQFDISEKEIISIGRKIKKICKKHKTKFIVNDNSDHNEALLKEPELIRKNLIEFFEKNLTN